MRGRSIHGAGPFGGLVVFDERLAVVIASPAFAHRGVDDVVVQAHAGDEQGETDNLFEEKKVSR